MAMRPCWFPHPETRRTMTNLYGIAPTCQLPTMAMWTSPSAQSPQKTARRSAPGIYTYVYASSVSMMQVCVCIASTYIPSFFLFRIYCLEMAKHAFGSQMAARMVARNATEFHQTQEANGGVHAATCRPRQLFAILTFAHTTEILLAVQMQTSIISTLGMCISPLQHSTKLPNTNNPVSLSAFTIFVWCVFRRAPGRAPVFDPCGMAGGGPKAGPKDIQGAKYTATAHAKQGDLGSTTLPARPTSTVWTLGEAVEVSWTIRANHGMYYYE
jgi:hypothetical protein